MIAAVWSRIVQYTMSYVAWKSIVVCIDGEMMTVVESTLTSAKCR